MTTSEGYGLIRLGVDTDVPGLDHYFDKVVVELRGKRNRNNFSIYNLSRFYNNQFCI